MVGGKRRSAASVAAICKSETDGRPVARPELASPRNHHKQETASGMQTCNYQLIYETTSENARQNVRQ